jgi:hypothetical protein
MQHQLHRSPNLIPMGSSKGFSQKRQLETKGEDFILLKEKLQNAD